MARREKILVVDRGAAEIAYPADWIVKPEPAGHLGITDPTDSAKLEISYLPFAIPKSDGPPLAQLLRRSLDNKDATGPVEVVESDRGDLWLAWADKPFDCDDTERKERRKAHSRTLVASNGRFYVLVTFSYWEDDRKWAVKAWERMIATLHLGDGVPLKSPYEHWALRDKKPEK